MTRAGAGKRDGWTRVRFGDVVENVNDQPKRATLPLDTRYVAGEHVDENRLKIDRWGTLGDDLVPPTFKRRFQPGDVLFHSRNLTKIAVPDFGGITGEKLFVLRSRSPLLVQDFVPYVLLSPAFTAYAEASWSGSVNKFLNWTPLERYEFALPPMDEQRRMVSAGKALSSSVEASRALAADARKVLQALGNHIAESLAASPTRTIYEICVPDRPLCYGVVQPGDPDGDVPLLRVCDLSDDGEVASFDSLNRITRAVDEQYRRSRVECGDVLVSVVGTIGRIAVVGNSHARANIARALARISPLRELMSPEFLAATLATPVFQSRLLHGAFETARKTLNLSELGQMQIPCPSLSEQRRVVDQITALREATFAARERAACTALSFQRFLLRFSSD
jgi:type I restriction enzyme S subunit